MNYKIIEKDNLVGIENTDDNCLVIPIEYEWIEEMMLNILACTPKDTYMGDAKFFSLKDNKFIEMKKDKYIINEENLYVYYTKYKEKYLIFVEYQYDIFTLERFKDDIEYNKSNYNTDYDEILTILKKYEEMV